MGLWRSAFLLALAVDAPPPPETTAPPPLALPAAPAPLGPLVSDRPDFTESTLTIPAGHLQLESGYTFNYDRHDGRRTKRHTFPEVLLRVGVAEDVELRIGWEGWARTESLSTMRNDVGRRTLLTETVTGGSDLSVGFKFHLADQDGIRPDLGLIVAADLPTGHHAYTSGDVDPNLGLLWAYDLDDDWSLAGNLNLALPTEAGTRIVEPSASLSVGYGITDGVGAYFEYFGFYPGSHGPDTHYVNGGLTFLVTDDFQIDLRAGAGLNDDSDDFFTGIGFVWRF